MSDKPVSAVFGIEKCFMIITRFINSSLFTKAEGEQIISFCEALINDTRRLIEKLNELEKKGGGE